MLHNYMIGDIAVLNRAYVDASELCLVLSSHPANFDILQECKEKYTQVYYVLTSSGKIEGPLFAGEIRRVSAT